MVTGKEVAQKLLEFYDSSSKWTKGWYAKDINAGLDTALSKDAVCWCALGAIRKIYIQPSDGSAYAKALALSIQTAFPDQEWEGVDEWNDGFSSFDEFRNALQRVAEAG